MLASAADRDRAVDLLKAAFGEGRLTKDEFDSRCARTMGARTYGDLAPVVADLPGGAAAPAPYPHYPPVPPTSVLASWALACGILEFFTAGMTSIPAVILGHMARNEIRRTGKRGEGLAIAGLVLGYLAIAGWTLLILAGIAITTSSSVGHVGPVGG